MKRSHEQQYQHNRQVLHELLAFQNPPYDWVVTVAFYSALHLIENVIAAYGFNSTSHSTRKRLAKQVPELLTILESYLLLEVESKRSRYTCEIINSDHAQVSIDFLTEIEEHLLTPAHSASSYGSNP